MRRGITKMWEGEGRGTEEEDGGGIGGEGLERM